MSKYKLSLIPGDGIGPELSEATMEILDAIQKKFDILNGGQNRRGNHQHMVNMFQDGQHLIAQ